MYRWLLPSLYRPLHSLYINIAGENGVIERNCDRQLTVRVEGAELLGFGSANPRTEERFETGTYATYYGRSQAVLLPECPEVKITVMENDVVVNELTICAE